MLDFILKFFLGFLLIGLVVFFHELSHFAAARLMKVDVDVISFGMGPRLFSFYGKKTEFRISAIPFGGYCRMKGSIDLSKALSDDKKKMDKKESGSYFASSPIKRMIIYASGPLGNFILAILLLALASSLPVERISNPCRVCVINDYPALFSYRVENPELVTGDLILKMDGKDVLDYEDFTSRLDGKSHSLIVKRDGETLEIILNPEKNGDDYYYGLSLYQEAVIGRSEVEMIKSGDRIVSANGKEIHNTLDLFSLSYPLNLVLLNESGSTYTYHAEANPLPFSFKSDLRKSSDAVGISALNLGIRKASEYFVNTMKALGAIITLNIQDARLVITGPTKAAQSIGNISTLAFSEGVSSGVRAVLYLLSIVSISLCVANIVPFPTFDGGGILINFIEIFKKEGLRPRTYVFLQILGMIIAFSLMAALYFVDIHYYFLS